MKYHQNDYELLYLIEQGNEDAKMTLYGKYKSILLHLANKAYRVCHDMNGASYEDFYQEACYGFEKAIVSFDDTKNILFYTYVTSCIKNQLSLYKRTITRKKDYPLNYAVSIYEEVEPGLSYADLFPSTDLTPYEVCENNEREKYLRIFQNNLPFMDACVFELRYNDFKYREMSELLDIPMHRITHILEKIKKKKVEFI